MSTFVHVCSQCQASITSSMHQSVPITCPNCKGWFCLRCRETSSVSIDPLYWSGAITCPKCNEVDINCPRGSCAKITMPCEHYVFATTPAWQLEGLESPPVVKPTKKRFDPAEAGIDLTDPTIKGIWWDEEEGAWVVEFVDDDTPMICKRMVQV